MSTKIDYENDIHIDEEALDVEWLEQPGLMRRYTKYAAQLGKVLAFAKENVDIVKAGLDLAIRRTKTNYGFKEEDKLTESMISSTLTLQQEYIDALHAYDEAQYEYNMVQGAVKAIDQRKSSLENLVKLHGASYFAGPRVPRDLSAEVNNWNAQKNTNAKISIGKHKKVELELEDDEEEEVTPVIRRKKRTEV